MSRRALLLAALLLSPVLLTAIDQARDPGAPGAPLGPTGTGVIAGTVLTPDGRPVRRARLSLSSSTPTINKTVIADDQGAFSFDALVPAAYTLSASKGGMLDSIYGQKEPGSGRPGTAIQLAAGQRLDRLKLTMPRGGVLTGTVIDEFGDPSFGTSVRATRYVYRGGVRTLVAAGTATTDDRGMYRLTALLPGEYVISAHARDAEGDAMRAREVRARLEMEMVRAAVIEGARPAPTVNEGPPPPVDAYAIVYHPGSSAGSAATTIPVGIGEERAGVDLQLRRVPVASISGTVVSLDGALGPETNVQVLDREQLLPIHGIRSTTARADGRFSIDGLPPGRYTLTVFGVEGGAVPVQATPVADLQRVLSQGLSPAERERAATRQVRLPTWATIDVTMSGRPVEGVVLTLQRGMTVAGNVIFEGAPPPADLTRVILRATMADTGDTTLAFEQPGAAFGPLDADGRFTIRGVVPGRYRITTTGAGQGFTLKSAMFNGRDVLDFPLDLKPGEDIAGGVVTFTTKSTELAGSLTDPNGGPIAEHTIVIFAADNRHWTPQSRRIASARPTTDGRFMFRGLPPGDYRLVAVADVEPGQWMQPDFLRQLVGRSVPVTLADGEKKAHDLRVARSR